MVDEMLLDEDGEGVADLLACEFSVAHDARDGLATVIEEVYEDGLLLGGVSELCDWRGRKGPTA